jgi:hypothetical protein
VLTLWDVIPRREERAKPAPAQRQRSRSAPSPSANGRVTMRDRYEAMTRIMLAEHNVRVRKWRSSMSGVAWQVTYADGSVSRLIEAPRPRGPMSAAVFLHEVGHHAIGFNRYSPRCLEEHMAWMFSLDAMARFDLNITDAVQRRVRHSMRYAIGKARRRGIKRIPPELAVYLTRQERVALGLEAADPERAQVAA